MVGDIIVHFVWISGNMMFWQEGNALSRGDFSSGVMAREKFLKFLPLHESAFERQEIVRGWCPSRNGKSWRVEKPEDWFYEVFLDPEGSWIWSPPPVIAKITVEQMCEVKYIFPQSRHLFICHLIMTGIWRKQLDKIADTQFSLVQGSTHWQEDIFEPLTIVLLTPLLSYSPWKAGRTTFMEKWKDKVRKVSWNDPQAFRNHMRNFWC